MCKLHHRVQPRAMIVFCGVPDGFIENIAARGHGWQDVSCCRYVEVQSGNSYHMKATLVTQAARSSYTCNEAAVGAAISRHDLSIQQVHSAHSLCSLLLSLYLHAHCNLVQFCNMHVSQQAHCKWQLFSSHRQPQCMLTSCHRAIFLRAYQRHV